MSGLTAFKRVLVSISIREWPFFFMRLAESGAQSPPPLEFVLNLLWMNVL